MAEFTEAQKLEIVTMLACFREPATIVKHLGDEYGIETDTRQIGAYDPTRSYYDAGDKWRDIFDAKRKQYIEEVASVPSANQGFRLNLLHEQIVKAAREDKPALMAQLLEQVAKEVGGVLTNMRDVRIDDNRRPRVSEMSAEDRKAMLAGLIAEAMAKRDPPGAAPAHPTAQ